MPFFGVSTAGVPGVVVLARQTYSRVDPQTQAGLFRRRLQLHPLLGGNNQFARGKATAAEFRDTKRCEAEFLADEIENPRVGPIGDQVGPRPVFKGKSKPRT